MFFDIILTSRILDNDFFQILKITVGSMYDLVAVTELYSKLPLDFLFFLKKCEVMDCDLEIRLAAGIFHRGTEN